MHVYREIVEPSSVSHSCSGRFDELCDQQSLVVVRGSSLLQLFHVHDRQMTLQSSVPLDGTVVAVSAVKLRGFKTDILAVAFQRAKLVLLAHDYIRASWTTVSMHHYEGELAGHHFAQGSFRPILTVAPSATGKSQCLAFMYEKDALALLPLDDESKFDDNMDLDSSSKLGHGLYSVTDRESTPPKVIFGNSFLLQSLDLDIDLINVKDILFLQGYRLPTLGLLYQSPARTWASSLALHRDTVGFMALDIDLTAHTSSAVIRSKSLPYDLQKIVSLNFPLAGTMLVGSNCIVYVDPSSQVQATAFNDFALDSSNLPMKNKVAFDLDLNGCTAAQVGTDVVFVLKDGGYLIGRFAVDGNRISGPEFICGDHVFPHNSTITVSCHVGDKTSVVFTGSADSDSKLISISSLKSSEVGAENEEAMEDDISAAYAECPAEKSLNNQLFNLEVLETLQVSGSASAMTSFELPISRVDGDATTILATAVGNKWSSSLALWRESADINTGSTLDLGESEGFDVLLSAGNYVVVSSDKSSILFDETGSMVEESAFNSAAKSFVLQRLPVGEWAYLHIFAGGAALYSERFQTMLSIQLPKPVKGAAACGAFSVLDFGDSLCLYHLDSEQFVEYHVLSTHSSVFAINEDMVIVGEQGSVSMTSLSKLDQVHKYDFTLLDTTVCESKPEQSREIAEELHAPIEQLVLASIGEAGYYQPYLSVVLANSAAIYSIVHTLEGTLVFRKEFAAPIYTENPIQYVETEERKHFIVAGGKPRIITKCRLAPLRARSLCQRRLKVATGHPGGFASLSFSGHLQFTRLNPDWDLSTHSWALKKIELDRPAVALAWHVSTECLAVATNAESEDLVEETKDTEMKADEAETEIEEEKVQDSSMIPLSYTGKVCLLSLNDWQFRPEISLPVGEAITAMCSCNLDIADNPSRRRELIVIGTALLKTEDGVSNGNLRFFDVGIDCRKRSTLLLDPESIRRQAIDDTNAKAADIPLGQNSRELVRGAVTALAPVMGKVLSAQGQRLMSRGLAADLSVEPVAFSDMGICATSLSVARNLVVCTDLHARTSLVACGTEPHMLYNVAMSSHDRIPAPAALASGAISCEPRGDLYFAIYDYWGRITLEQFNPALPAAKGGQRLVNSTSFYTGRVSRCTVSVNGFGDDLAVVAGSVDGTLSAIYPVEEIDYRALHVLTQQMLEKEQPAAGLNPKAHRAFGTNGLGAVGNQHMMDYNLAQRFWILPRQKQLHYARRLGRNGPEQVWEALQQDPFDYF